MRQNRHWAAGVVEEGVLLVDAQEAVHRRQQIVRFEFAVFGALETAARFHKPPGQQRPLTPLMASGRAFWDPPKSVATHSCEIMTVAANREL